MIYFYLLPLDVKKQMGGGRARGPAYLNWRYGEGLDCKWSLKDFGEEAGIGLVATDQSIAGDGVYLLGSRGAFSAKDKSNLSSYLKSWDVNDLWIRGVDNWREALHRITGLALALQADSRRPEWGDPSYWLTRRIHFGQAKLNRVSDEIYTGRLPKMDDWVLNRDDKGWLNTKTGQFRPFIQGGALPATDDFTTGSDQALATYSANWTQNNGACQVLAASDDIHSNQATDWLAHWNADTFDDDQYSEVTFSTATFGPSQNMGVSCRVAASAVTGYTQQGKPAGVGDNKWLSKLVSGSWTTLAVENVNGYSTGDTLRIEAEGTTITPKVNGSEDTDLGAQTDSAISSGSAGVCGYGTATNIRLDDWEGGNLAAGRTTKNTDSNPLGIHTGMAWRINQP